MKRVAFLLLAVVMACLISTSIADAKEKKAKPAPDEIFAKMDTDKNGFVTETEYVAFQQGHHKKSFDEAKAKADYAAIVGTGDKAKGFDVAAFKTYQETKHKGKKK
jgi:hypothetical protein